MRVTQAPERGGLRHNGLPDEEGERRSDLREDAAACPEDVEPVVQDHSPVQHLRVHRILQLTAKNSR